MANNEDVKDRLIMWRDNAEQNLTRARHNGRFSDVEYYLGCVHTLDDAIELF